MKRILVLVVSISALLLGACTSDSALPNPTGKGNIRAINAIKGSPQINFLIEERVLHGVLYKTSSQPFEYDDFHYDLHFEITYPGDSTSTRVATETLDVEADTDHILLLTGDIDAPTVTTYGSTSREFAGTETVFEARFLHANAALGNVDVYFEDPTIAPGTNPPTATLSFGEMADATDFEEGSYIMTVTAAGDASTVYFTSRETVLLPLFAHVVTIFEGDNNDTAPVMVRSMTAIGNPLTLVDANYPPQIQFIHGASTLEPVDIYDDELLTNLVYSGLNFGEISPGFDASEEATSYYFTPVASTAVVLFESDVSAAPPGTYTDAYLIGDTDDWSAVRSIQDRSAVLISSRIRIFHSGLNQTGIDIYLQDRDVPISEESTPVIYNVLHGSASPALRIAESNFDIYVTAANEQVPLAGPFQFDATPGTDLELLLVDRIGDPSVLDFIDITIR